MSWPRQKLEFLASNEPYSFVGGPFGSKLISRDYVDEGIPVIRGSNLNNGRFLDMSDFVFVSDSKVRKDLSSNLAKPRDLIFTQRGTLGQVALVPEDGFSDRYVVSQSQMKLTVDEKKADHLFLYYYFSSREAVEKILSFVSSSGVPHINLTVLRNFEVPVPPLQTQYAIAGVLSAYDDLIENNRRRIQLLEQAARLLYKEWFSHLRFPGHEHVKITDGVPVGWERKMLGDLCEEVRESVSPDALEPDTPYIGLEHMPRRSISLNEWGKAEEVISSKHRFREGEILFGKIRPYFHKVGIAFVDGVASSDAIVIRPLNEHLRALVLMTVSSDGFVAVTAQTMKEGSKMPRADWKQMKQYLVLLPPDGLLSTFNSVVESIVQQLKSLSFTNRHLIAFSISNETEAMGGKGDQRRG
jgi:type I restriction enzyme, S subunit